MTSLPELGTCAKRASLALALASTGAKDAALLAAADLLLQRSDEIVEANAADVGRAQAGGVASTVVDRLRLSPTAAQLHGQRAAPGSGAGRPRG